MRTMQSRGSLEFGKSSRENGVSAVLSLINDDRSGWHTWKDFRSIPTRLDERLIIIASLLVPEFHNICAQESLIP